jgi:hypothetical protein
LNPNQAFLLYWHLCNENNVDWYGIEKRSDKGAVFRWNFTTQPHVAIFASLKTTASLAAPARRLAFVPFVCHTWRYRSRWAALRIEGGDGDGKVVQRRAAEAFCRLQQLVPRMCSILESTGANNWQIWAIANGYRPWTDWSELLARVVSEANLDDSPGQYDLFPSPAALVKPRMLGLRAPGAWNPGTDTIAQLHSHNLLRFMPLIVRRYEGTIAKGARI